jgi:hypothetical protein
MRQKNTKRIILSLARRGIFNWIPDKAYVKIQYKLKIGKKLNLKLPVTFNEKLQWLKIYDRNPEYIQMVDKYKVREYIADKIGGEYLIPLLGVWDKFDDIDFQNLPDQFVLKCTHDSGGIVICRNKNEFDIDAAKKKINKCLKKNYYWQGREWAYKDVPRKIIAEKYMEDETYKELRDYKFFCFNGEPKIMFVGTERQVKGEEVKFDFFDMDYKHLDIKNGHPNAKLIPEKPINFEKMKELAKKLSKNIPHVRVDFYEVNGDIFFGELTFYHFSGMVPFIPEEWDYKLGEWIKLPDKK